MLGIFPHEQAFIAVLASCSVSITPNPNFQNSFRSLLVEEPSFHFSSGLRFHDTTADQRPGLSLGPKSSGSLSATNSLGSETLFQKAFFANQPLFLYHPFVITIQRLFHQVKYFIFLVPDLDLNMYLCLTCGANTMLTGPRL